jgi:hypothetical protein
VGSLLRILLRLPPIIPLVLFLAIAVLTSRKIFRMAQIRGWISGARTEHALVVHKWRESGRYLRYVTKEGPEEQRVPEELYHSVNVGDQVEVRYLEGDRTPYLARGVYASPGNFIFDGFLLLLEIAAILFFLRQFVLARAAARN